MDIHVHVSPTSTTNQKEEETLAKGTTFGGAGYLKARY
jgi:hypothetical protein